MFVFLLQDLRNVSSSLQSHDRASSIAGLLRSSGDGLSHQKVRALYLELELPSLASDGLLFVAHLESGTLPSHNQSSCFSPDSQFRHMTRGCNTVGVEETDHVTHN